MPYSITTQDGITIDGIPDEIPADSPELKTRVAKIRGERGTAGMQPGATPAPAAAPVAQPITKLERLWKGVRDPFDAAAQMVRRAVPDGVGEALDNADRWLGERTGGVFMPVEEGIRTGEREYQAGRRAAARNVSSLVTGQEEDPGFDGYRLIGNVVSPINYVPGMGLGKKVQGAKLLLHGARAGAIGAAFQPIVAPEGQTDADFWKQKAGQVVAGAVTGGIATPIVSKVAGAAASGAQKLAGRAQRYLTRVTPEQVQVAAANAARANGVEWADLPPGIQEAVQQQVHESLSTGQRLDPAAILRRAEAESVGLVDDAALTTGQATRNPMQFTQERNLRGVEISTPQGRGNPLMERFANQNQALVRNFDELGAAGATDASQAGQTLIDALQAADRPVRQSVDEAYAAARAMNNGRAAPLERGTFIQAANAALDEGQLGSFVPANVQGLLNRIAQGQTPFDVDAAVQIDTILSGAQRQAGRGTPEALALGRIRDALRQTPLQATDFPDGGAGQAARDAFDTARQAARDRFATIERTPAMAAALDNEAPDRFVQRFLLNGNARDLQAMREALQSDPQALAQARAQVAAYLRRAAFGENMTGDKPFAPERYAQTLRSIGGQRLAAFFSPEEIAQLNTLSRVGGYINTQPAGSAVNSSNTASGLLTMLSRLAQTPALRQIPGARAVANQVGEIQTERAINEALSGRLPPEVADLPPELVRAGRRLLPAVGIGSGAAVAAPRE